MSDCPTPSKTPYPTETAARRGAAHIKHDRRGPQLSPYQCPCGDWHLKSGKSLNDRIRIALAGGDRR